MLRLLALALALWTPDARGGSAPIPDGAGPLRCGGSPPGAHGPGIGDPPVERFRTTLDLAVTVDGPLDPEQADHMVRRHRNTLSWCHDRELTAPLKAAAQLTLHATVAPDGVVGDVTHATVPAALDDAAACLTTRVERLRFGPTPGGDASQVDIHLNYRPLDPP